MLAALTVQGIVRHTDKLLAVAAACEGADAKQGVLDLHAALADVRSLLANSDAAPAPPGMRACMHG